MLFWTVLLALTGGAVWLLARLWRVAAIGAAYKAKVLCSIMFGTGRDIDPGRAEEVSAEAYRLLRLFHARVDPIERSVTVSLLGLRPRSAFYRPRLGATLLPRRLEGLVQEKLERGSEQLDGATLDPTVECALRSSTVDPRALPATTTAGDRSTALNEVVDAAFAEPDLRRLRRTRAVVVLRDGRIVAERYAPGFGATTPFPGWSMTKSVIGALVGILIGEGRLSLGDTALMPEWRAPDPRADIRLEDLLRMRSGLTFSEVYADLSSDVIEMLFNRADAASYASSRPLGFPPGTTWSYSSGTTNILSRIARRVVGDADYLEWPRRALFDPIGMTSAIMEPDGSGTFVGSSFMLATARDWARFGQLHLQDGMWEGRRIIPDGWVRFSTSPTPQSPEGIYGAHWWRKLQAPLGGETPAAARIAADAFFAIGHEGQTLTVIPSLGLVIVRLGLSIAIDAWNHASFLADLQDAL